jgi:hypothetical protein
MDVGVTLVIKPVLPWKAVWHTGEKEREGGREGEKEREGGRERQLY